MKSANRERNKTLCSVLQSAVIDLCREKYFVDSADWEVDGIICISVPESREQHVVKIHEKFPLESLRKLADINDICYACEKQREKYAEEGHPHDRDNSFQNSEEEERYRDVSVIDLEHALQTDNVVDTGQSHQIQHEAESVRGDKFRSKNHTEQEGYFLQGQYVNETSHQGSSRNAEVYGSRNDRHSVKSSGEPFAEPFSNIPNEPLPPPPVDIGDEADYTIIKNEPSESEDFDLHMQCINEDYDVNVQKASVVDKRDLAADSESFLAASEHKQSPALKQFDNSARAWSQRKHPPPSSTVSSAASQPLVSTGEPFPSGAASSAFGQPVSVKGNNVTLIKSDMNNTNINISPSALGSQPSSSSQQKGIGMKNNLISLKTSTGRANYKFQGNNNVKKTSSVRNLHTQTMTASSMFRSQQDNKLVSSMMTQMRQQSEKLGEERKARTRELTRLRVQRYRERKKSQTPMEQCYGQTSTL